MGILMSGKKDFSQKVLLDTQCLKRLIKLISLLRVEAWSRNHWTTQGSSQLYLVEHCN